MTPIPRSGGDSVAVEMLGLSFLFLLLEARLDSEQYLARYGAISKLYFKSNASISEALEFDMLPDKSIFVRNLASDMLAELPGSMESVSLEVEEIKGMYIFLISK
jgi:hypothetical protein